MYDLLRFLLLSGFRISEATTLKWNQIHYDDGYIGLPSKNGLRIDPYPLNVELRTFLESLPHHYSPHVFLYESKSHPGHWVRNVVKKEKWGKYREAENKRDDTSKEGRLSIHTLRKNFGTYMAGLGMPPQKLQELLRHSNFATTRSYYLKVKVDENRAELDRRESLLAHVEGIKRSA
jgi:integrase